MRLQGVPLAPGQVSAPAALQGIRPEVGPRVRVGGTVPDEAWPAGVVGWVARSATFVRSATTPVGPVVGGIDVDLFREHDPLAVDGSLGIVDLTEVEETPVVTAFLERHDSRILLLRRSDQVGSFRGAWAGVSGFLEDPTAEGQARREIAEETGILPDQCRLASVGPPLLARGDRRLFVVHPFRFGVGDVQVRLDWEHTAFAWVLPDEIARRPTVPRLDRAWRSVAPRPQGDR